MIGPATTRPTALVLLCILAISAAVLDIKSTTAHEADTVRVFYEDDDWGGSIKRLQMYTGTKRYLTQQPQQPPTNKTSTPRPRAATTISSHGVPDGSGSSITTVATSKQFIAGPAVDLAAGYVYFVRQDLTSSDFQLQRYSWSAGTTHTLYTASQVRSRHPNYTLCNKLTTGHNHHRLPSLAPIHVHRPLILASRPPPRSCTGLHSQRTTWRRATCTAWM